MLIVLVNLILYMVSQSNIQLIDLLIFFVKLLMYPIFLSTCVGLV